jgi:ABC-type phosphate/phosphonate transport system substrate-binding protein
MIANARMYSVSPEAAALWRRLLAALIAQSQLEIELLDHAEPAPIGELWRRKDMAAVFMCGLPYSLSHPRVQLIAAPVPAAPEFLGLPQYWSEMVVRKDSEFMTVNDTFGGRIAMTVPDSQSGCVAALYYLMTAGDRFPLYEEVIAPRVTPQGAIYAVIDRAADVAPIDSYAYRLLQKYRPDLTSQLRIVARTASTPIPPLVASRPGLERLQAAFLQAHRIAAIAPLLSALLLEKFVRPDPASYDALRLNFEAAGRYWREHRLAAKVHPDFAAAPTHFAT